MGKVVDKIIPDAKDYTLLNTTGILKGN